MIQARPFLRAVAFAALLLACDLATGQEKRMPDKAAPFTLTGLDGKPVRLSDFKGKVILLDFWATWCVPCQTEVPRFIAFQNKYGDQGFQVIGISMDDTPYPVRKFYAQYKLNYPVAMGTTKVADSYGGVLGLPLTYLIARNGRIIKQYDASADFEQMEAEIKLLLSQENAPE